MQTDIVKAYVEIRQKLIAEKAQLEQRLREINRVLGGAAVVPAAPAEAAAEAEAAPARRGGRFMNKISLPKAVLQVTSVRPLTKMEILDEVKKLGYRFMAKNPLTSLNPLLYGKNPRYNRVDGRFSPASGALKKLGQAKAGAPKKRTLSPAARAKLAAIARARWARVKRAGRSRL